MTTKYMPDIRPAFVFVHSAWLSAATWQKLIPLLEARGYVARALDLPGAGANAKAPSSYDRRPLDAAAFASEPSPNASVTQEDRTRAVIALVEDTRRQTGAPIVLVGHSLGGLTVTAVAETIPEQLKKISMKKTTRTEMPDGAGKIFIEPRCPRSASWAS